MEKIKFNVKKLERNTDEGIEDGREGIIPHKTDLHTRYSMEVELVFENNEECEKMYQLLTKRLGVI